MRHIAIAVLAVLLGLSGAQAARVQSFSPQGVVSRVQSIRAAFDGSVVVLGDARAPAPFVIQCDDPKLSGAGRWLDTRHWVYEFSRAPAAGVSCTATASPDFRDLKGRGIEGASRYSFSTGGPRASVRAPWSSKIAEDQVFVLGFNADVDAVSVGEH